MTSTKSLLPALRATVTMAVIFTASAAWFGLLKTTQVLIITFILSNLAVVTTTFLFSLLSWWLVEFRIVCSIIYAAAFWFLTHIGLPLSYIVVAIGLLRWNDSQFAPLFSSLNVLQFTPDLVGRIGLALSASACVLFLDRILV